MLASGEVHIVTMSDVVPGVATTPRGAAWACVRYQETTVVLVCVHLSGGRFDDVVMKSLIDADAASTTVGAACRLKQSQLAEILRKVSQALSLSGSAPSEDEQSSRHTAPCSDERERGGVRGGGGGSGAHKEGGGGGKGHVTFHDRVKGRAALRRSDAPRSAATRRRSSVLASDGQAERASIAAATLDVGVPQ